MKRLELQAIRPAGMDLEQWISQQFATLNEASLEDAADAAGAAFAFDEAAVTETTTFDPASATTTEVRNVLSTLLMYLRRGAPDKKQ